MVSSSHIMNHLRSSSPSLYISKIDRTNLTWPGFTSLGCILNLVTSSVTRKGGEVEGQGTYYQKPNVTNIGRRIGGGNVGGSWPFESKGQNLQGSVGRMAKQKCIEEEEY